MLCHDDTSFFCILGLDFLFADLFLEEIINIEPKRDESKKDEREQESTS
jgi:hypothetical protein